MGSPNSRSLLICSSCRRVSLAIPHGQLARWATQALVTPLEGRSAGRGPGGPYRLLRLEEERGGVGVGWLKAPREHGLSMETRFLEPGFGQGTF